jgi:hypothetical protein
MQRTKYPRTHHLPWSQLISSDDLRWSDCAVAVFEDKEVVITEKLDGECTTVYPDGWIHARSLDSGSHPSRSWMKAFASEWAYNIPAGYRVCGENLYAYHSIFYTNLPTYFFAFGIYDEQNKCLSWKETAELCELLGIQTVPVLYNGIWDAKFHESWRGTSIFPSFESPGGPPTGAEGYVVRLAESFPYADSERYVAKFVRKNHVTTSEQWMFRPVKPNALLGQ